MTDETTDEIPAAAAVPCVVRLIDLSAESDDDRVVETVSGFTSLDHANAFARAYVRDSLERCRVGDAAAAEVLAAWRAFGEDAEVVQPDGDTPDAAWHSTSEAATFAASPASPMERDWRALDPRAAGAAPVDDEADHDPGVDAEDDEAIDEDLIPPTILVDLPPRRPQ